MNAQPLQKDKWLGLIEDQEKSGLSISAFCKSRQLNLSQMHYYRKILKKSNASTNNPIEETLVPIKITAKKDKELSEETPLTEEVHLIFSNGIQCILPKQTEMAQLKSLVEVLMSC